MTPIHPISASLPATRRLASRGRQRGATMVSVMMLTVSLMTVGLLAVRSSVRDVTSAGQLVARERALVAAQAALDLAAAQYVTVDPVQINGALQGFSPQLGASCADPCGDCIPDPAISMTGQRNDVLSGQPVSCGGKPCMRQGAVVNLRDATNTPTPWCQTPLRDLLAEGDAEATVSVWVRNNAADALGGGSSPNGWLIDEDGRIVLTATASVRNTTVTIEQEVMLSLGFGPTSLLPQSPDEGYGGGHNNDNSAVSVCAEEYTSAAQN